ncbi:Putative negative regulator of RcsB-dependent stress response [Allopseudospirillum japonicum]|uniref:Ancillary SecYEG translocon subunit n=1 Tax=Allopseudospirillum japonicum TaxID=64971 RepID=A0A1H6RP88_9GAMM|nr:tetratricopeptide repeat protein [Allopseudospirillum japonicum]SEI57579.1 Putative negative regulator of RcsB-dependent stress response [Allopseudospirillum japonicum]
MRTEEEQLEAIKHWWNTQGKSWALIIAIGVGAGMAWRGYQDWQVGKLETASDAYQQVISQLNAGQSLDDLKEQTQAILTDYPNSLYADQILLLQAQAAVTQDDLATAQQRLQAVQASSQNPLIKEVAILRQARILAAQENTSGALQLLEGVKLEALQIERFAIQGDILLAQGDSQGAYTAYSKALEYPNAQNTHPWLSIKRDNLTPPVTESATPAA